MDELNKFPRKPLIYAGILCSLFALCITGACFYHPAIPHPSRIQLNAVALLREEGSGYYVTARGAAGSIARQDYRLKMVVNGETGFYNFRIDKQIDDSSFEGRLLVHKAANPFVNSSTVEAIIYNDSTSALPLIRLMFK